MDFLSLPIEVVEDSILSQVGWNDLLRLRRVSKGFKNVIQAYVNQHPELAPEIKIGEKEKGRTLRAFLELGIPSCKLCLNNSPIILAKSEDTVPFLEKYGDMVTHLHLTRIPAYGPGKERQFLEALPNLKSLVVDELNMNMFWDSNVFTLYSTVPVVFRQLETLKLSKITLNYWTDDDIKSLEDCLTACEALKYLYLPYLERDGNRARLFRFLGKIIKQRGTAGQRNLKTIDFQNLNNPCAAPATDEHREMHRSFVQLWLTSSSKSVALHNVRDTWFTSVLAYPLSRKMGISVVSLHCFSCPKTLLKMKLPNLKRLSILSIGNLGKLQFTDEQSAHWPLLQSLDVTLDDGCSMEDVENACRFLFENTVYDNLTELCVTFPSPSLDNLFDDRTELFINQFIDSCPNVTKLTFKRWAGRCRSMARIWQNFGKLEEVSLVDCCLKDRNFFGRRPGSCTFLNLRNLKKLSILGLKKPSAFTERTFSSVIRHMSLTHFVLSNGVKERVNLDLYAGLQSLLEGPFAQSIERLQIKGKYRLVGATQEELKRLLKSFRCNAMM